MPPRRSRFARAAVALATTTFLRVSGTLPLSFNRAVAIPAGRVLACLVPRVWRTGLANLDLAFGGRLTAAEKRRILWGVIDNLSTVASEFSHLPQIVHSDAGVSVIGAENITKGQGYLCLGAHLGNWELMGPVMAIAGGYKVAEVVRPFDHPSVDRAIDMIRTRGNVTTIPKDRAGREILRLLKDGYLVGVMADQSPRDNGIPVTFFGAPCWATVGPVMIAVRAKVPVVPVSLTRKHGGGYVLRFYPPIEMERTGNLRADLVRNSQRCQDAIEAMVRDNPDQWLWLHRRWKERPRLAREWKEREARDR